MSLTSQLSIPVAKAMPLRPLLAVAAITLALGWTAMLQPPETGFRLLPVRLGVVALALYAAFVFDDPASDLTSPTPHPLRLRRLLRALYAGMFALAVLGLVLLLASRGMDLVWTIPDEPIAESGQESSGTVGRSPFPAGRLALETVTSIALALAVAAAISHRGQTEPGRIASTIVLGTFLISWMIPEAYRPWADPNDERWSTSAKWWSAALVVLLLVAVVFSWEERHHARGLKV